MVKLALVIYNVFFPLLFLIYLPVYMVKLVRRGNFLCGFSERFGWYSTAKQRQLSTLNRPTWIHAVSVGETNTALLLIKAWARREPQRQFVLSTTTSTGQAIARRKSPENVTVIYAPLDHAVAVTSALRHINPEILVIMEVEIWPTLISLANVRGVKLALVNGRLSDRSAAGYYKHRWLFGQLLRRFSIIGVQTDDDAARIVRITNAPAHVHVVNTMKFDQTPDTTVGSDAQALVHAIFGDDIQLLVAASTWPGEEQIITRIYWKLRDNFPKLRLILVPRHAERAGDIEAMLTAEQIPQLRLTHWRQSAPHQPSVPPVLIADTTGELLSLLAVADIVFVGKSMAGNSGGQNIIEPALFGKPIIFGDRVENFRVVARIFLNANAAVQVADALTLEATVQDLLADDDKRQRMGAAARQTVIENQGAVVRSLDLLTADATQNDTRSTADEE